MSKKEFVGISLEGELLKIARVHFKKGRLVLDKLDHITLVESLENKESKSESDDLSDFSFDDNQDEEAADSIFGIEEGGTSNGTLVKKEPKKAIQDDDMLSMSDGEVGESVESNELLIRNLLSGINTKRVNLAFNIPSGSTIFQIIKDQNHLDLKKKEITGIIDEKLESIYGTTKSSDHYSYEIREDGSLILASNDNEIDLLNLIDQVKDLYSGKIFINEILPDEAALIGLVRNNYDLGEDEITGIVHLSKKSTRLIFLKGSQVWSVTPLINEGTKSNHVLSTIFSKILFQLDTGELPSLERIVITNNVLGDNAISFFKKNFSDIAVEDLRYDDSLIDIDPEFDSSLPSFTTAIGLAWSAAGYENEAYKAYSFLPDYIAERQKVFKLQWHGVLLLFLIAIVPVLFNFVYQRNVKKINNLQNQILRTDSQIDNVRPLVIGVNTLSNKFNQIDNQIKRLELLNKGTDKWERILSALNNGVAGVNSCWLTAMNSVKGGILIQGYSLYRNRIPEFTDLFSNALLQDVHIAKMKGRKVYKFTIMVHQVFKKSK